jgi:hypothetical protein
MLDGRKMRLLVRGPGLRVEHMALGTVQIQILNLVVFSCRWREELYEGENRLVCGPRAGSRRHRERHNLARRPQVREQPQPLKSRFATNLATHTLRFVTDPRP